VFEPLHQQEQRQERRDGQHDEDHVGHDQNLLLDTTSTVRGASEGAIRPRAATLWVP
jgi:hypothetical protein